MNIFKKKIGVINAELVRKYFLKPLYFNKQCIGPEVYKKTECIEHTLLSLEVKTSLSPHVVSSDKSWHQSLDHQSAD